MVKNTTASHFHQLLPKDVTSHLRIWILSSTEAKSGYKFVDILKASITKLKYSWNKQMNTVKTRHQEARLLKSGCPVSYEETKES